jgi:hypothetical protein
MMAVAIAGGGIAVGAVTAAGPGEAARAPAATAPSGQTPRSSYAGVVRRVLPSVVLIRTANGLGSGVVLDGNGNIVTNAHVAGDAASFQVQLAGDPKPRPARLVGAYPAGDLAVIHASDATGLKPASFGDSGKVQAGDVVLAVGNPLGLSSSVTEGIISATGRVREFAGDGAARCHPDQRADQPRQQRWRAGEHRRPGGRHPDAGRGQCARQPGAGHRVRDPGQYRPRHRCPAHRLGPRHQHRPGRDGELSGG